MGVSIIRLQGLIPCSHLALTRVPSQAVMEAGIQRGDASSGLTQEGNPLNEEWIETFRPELNSMSNLGMGAGKLARHSTFFNRPFPTSVILPRQPLRPSSFVFRTFLPTFAAHDRSG